MFCICNTQNNNLYKFTESDTNYFNKYFVYFLFTFKPETVQTVCLNIKTTEMHCLPCEMTCDDRYDEIDILWYLFVVWYYGFNVANIIQKASP